MFNNLRRCTRTEANTPEMCVCFVFNGQNLHLWILSWRKEW